jgi:hypothetical protein
MEEASSSVPPTPTITTPPKGIDTERIKTIVRSIQEATVSDKFTYFETKYANFKKKYPMLYEQACKNSSFDMKSLDFMLQLLEQMQSSSVSQYDASASVGQMLYNKYIHENIKDLPPTKK